MTTAQNPGPRSLGYRGDPLFKGCTRPAMVFGVPILPFVIVTGGVVLLAAWTTIFLIIFLPVAILVMRQITKTDDQMFRLLGLKMRFRLFNYNHNGRFWKASAYSPVAFKKRK